MPRSLDLSRLQQFEPAGQGEHHRPEPDVSLPERWPSREAVRDGQISIKAPLGVIARFRKLCKDDRRTYADMLAILMDEYAKNGR